MPGKHKSKPVRMYLPHGRLIRRLSIADADFLVANCRARWLSDGTIEAIPKATEFAQIETAALVRKFDGVGPDFSNLREATNFVRSLSPARHAQLPQITKKRANRWLTL